MNCKPPFIELTRLIKVIACQVCSHDASDHNDDMSCNKCKLIKVKE